MSKLKIYFSDFFGVDDDLIEAFGAVNISLINDMPLFIDPFLLFNSEKDEYQKIHTEIINYLIFLQGQASNYKELTAGMLSAWYLFSEVKQTWMGFSLEGNGGRGLGKDFANNLHNGLQTIFADFGKETITKTPHLEKLCLISPLVGRDKISDFTTNFAKEYILEYTQKFAMEYLELNQCKKFKVPKVKFNYNTKTWMSKEYVLPCYNDDYVLLTPCDLLTRDETFINRVDMINNLQAIAPSIGDAGLRFQLNNYFREVLSKKKKEMSKTDKERAAASLIRDNPELIDYYIKYKEENEQEATSINKQVVDEVKMIFNTQLKALTNLLYEKTDFYKKPSSSYDEAYNRVMYLKSVIEDMDGYRIFYSDGKPIKREADLQVMYRLVWYATEFDVNREVNNGRGPVDYKVSKGSIDSTLIEFKLASNTKMRRNLENQVEIYKKANCTDRAIKVILFFTDKEYEKTLEILSDLKLSKCKDIILIDARNDKISASNV